MSNRIWMFARCPLLPRNQPNRCAALGDASGKNRTHTPQQTVSLFDHVVGERQQLRWHFEAERPGGPEVDHELEFGGLHDRQIGGLLPLEIRPA